MLKAHFMLGHSARVVPWALALGALFFLMTTYSGQSLASVESKRKANAEAVPKRANFKLTGANGYAVSVTISNQGSTIVASKGHTAALYSARWSRVKEGNYEASFSKFGHINVHFDRNARRAVACSRHPLATQAGTFSGVIKFQGEAKFTVVSAKTAPGVVASADCKSLARANRVEVVSQAGKPASSFSLHALTVEKGSVVEFYAGSNAIQSMSGWENKVGVPLGLDALKHRAVGFSAVSFGRKYGVRIVRLAAAASPGNAFLILTSGKLTARPSAPFAGIGQMAVCRPGSWHGDIRIQFPGREMKLAGARTLAVVKPTPKNCA